MVFILLTYGGWNEAAYLSGELQNAKRNMARALVFGVLIVIGLYLFDQFRLPARARPRRHPQERRGRRRHDADRRRRAGRNRFQHRRGPVRPDTLNGTIITGSRSYYALGRDLFALRHIGTWEERGSTPANALLLQGALSVAAGDLRRRDPQRVRGDGRLTAPVFWFFMLLVAISIYIFRSRETGGENALSRAALSADPSDPRPHLRLDALFEPGLCRMGIDRRRRDAAARHAAAVPQAQPRHNDALASRHALL